MKKKLMSNRFFQKALAVRTASQDPLQKFKFHVSIPRLPTDMGFQRVSGLTDEVSVIEYAEGGTDYLMKLPGRRKVNEVTCERGQYANSGFHELMLRTLTDQDLRNTVIITQYNRFGRPAKVYKLANAWVSKWEGTDLDAKSDDVAIEKITIQFEYYL